MFLLVMLLTVALTLIVGRFVRTQQQLHFSRDVQTYERELNQRLQNYGNALNATRALWESGDRVSGAEFARFVAALDLPNRYPGLMSLGYAPWLPVADLPAYLERERAAGRTVTLRPAGARPVYVPVELLQPPQDNLDRVLGFDMYSEPLRRAAMDRARETGLLTSTRRVNLLIRQGGGSYAGLLLYAPVFRDGQLRGFAYAPLSLDRLLPGLGSSLPLAGDRHLRPGGGVELAVRLVPAVQSSPVLLGATLGRLQLRVSLDRERLSGPASLPNAFTEQDRLTFAGQNWVLDFAADRDYGRDGTWVLPWAVLLMGTLVALFAAHSVRRQVEARLRAERAGLVLSESRAALERARAEFEAIFLAIQDAAIFTDPQGVVLLSNPAMTRTFGLEPHELRGTPMSDLYADPLLAERLSEQSVRPELDEVQQLTTLFRRKGGAQGDGQPTFYGEMQRSPVLGAGGELLGQLKVVRDISERLRADHALRGSERRAQGVLEGMPQIVWLTDARGLHFTLNRRWGAYVGEEREKRPFLELIHPQDRAEFRHRFAEAVARGDTFESEHRLLSASGEYRTFVSRGRPLSQVVGRPESADEGAPDEWVGTSTDIEDQVYSEMTSRLLADLTQTLLAQPVAAQTVMVPSPEAPSPETPSLEDALSLLTARYADAALLWLSGDEWVRPLHHARAGLPGTGALALLPAVQDALAAVRERGEARVLHGEPLHEQALSSLLLLPLPPGSPLGVLGLGFRQPVQDRQVEVAQELALRLMTALDNREQGARTLAAQQALRELNNSLETRVSVRTAELSEANAELEAFSYSVSHDLRTPLRHIAGFGDLLRKELERSPQTDKAQRYLGIIASSAERMNTLIDDLLEFSRTSRAELTAARVEPTALFRALLREAQPDLSDRDVQVEVGDIPAVRGDASLLRQVFANLLSNALKYTRTRAHARVDIMGVRAGDEVILSVRDNGVGFDPQYAPKLFGVFSRLHRAEEFEGTGIGLANVRRIVARHGGRVWAESGWRGAGEPGEGGATFFVALPAEVGSGTSVGCDSVGGSGEQAGNAAGHTA